MTNNIELQQMPKETNTAYVKRLQGALAERKQAEQDAYEMWRHLERSFDQAKQDKVPASVLNEMSRTMSRAAVKLGVARGNVEVATIHLVTALQR